MSHSYKRIAIAKGSRCLPKVDKEGTYKSNISINNSIDYHLYEEVARIGETPLLVSRESNLALLSFQPGLIRDKSAIMSTALSCVHALEDRYLHHLDGLDALVLCGHSQGAVTAEAVALICSQRRKLERVPIVLVNSGAHMWMSRTEVLSITKRFSFISFAKTDDHIADHILLMTKSSGELASLPKTFISESVDGVMEDVLEPSDEIIVTGDARYVSLQNNGKQLHDWSVYERALATILSKQGGGGNTLHRLNAGLALFVFAMSVVPRL